MGSGPKVELIACAAAREAAVDVPLNIHREARCGGGRTVRQRAGAAELGTAGPGRTEVQQFQDPGHGDLGTQGRVVDRREGGTWHG